MEKSRVYLIKCDSYDEEEVRKACFWGMSKMEEDGIRIPGSDSILLKPNLLSPAPPEKAVTTHPAVFKGVAGYFLDTGRCSISYGDSPGTSGMKAAASAGKIDEAADELGIETADFSHYENIEYPEGRVAKKFSICKGVLEADSIVNICKMKTHALERVTGAVKNIYGVVHGTSKAIGHTLYPNAERFAAMLSDLHGCIPVRMHIMDGITAMEGNGPSNGDPVNMGILMFSEDPVAIDSVFCHLVDLDTGKVPTVFLCEKYGLGNGDPENIEIITPEGVKTMEEAVHLYGNRDFDVYRGGNSLFMGTALEILTRPFSMKPAVSKDKCVSCGLCEKNCPVNGKAVHMKEDRKRGKKYPKYEYNKCIKCFCCQELCPAGAISLKRFVL